MVPADFVPALIKAYRRVFHNIHDDHAPSAHRKAVSSDPQADSGRLATGSNEPGRHADSDQATPGADAGAFVDSEDLRVDGVNEPVAPEAKCGDDVTADVTNGGERIPSVSPTTAGEDDGPVHESNVLGQEHLATADKATGGGAPDEKQDDAVYPVVPSVPTAPPAETHLSESAETGNSEETAPATDEQQADVQPPAASYRESDREGNDAVQTEYGSADEVLAESTTRSGAVVDSPEPLTQPSAPIAPETTQHAQETEREGSTPPIGVAAEGAGASSGEESDSTKEEVGVDSSLPAARGCGESTPGADAGQKSGEAGEGEDRDVREAEEDPATPPAKKPAEKSAWGWITRTWQGGGKSG